jgi:aminoglycoside N3'-acetyltransferase
VIKREIIEYSQELTQLLKQIVESSSSFINKKKVVRIRHQTTSDEQKQEIWSVKQKLGIINQILSASNNNNSSDHPFASLASWKIVHQRKQTTVHDPITNQSKRLDVGHFILAKKVKRNTF